ncbi:cobalt transporter ATP-binding subunit [Salmonella enterica subsp. enterica serovar Typhimurium str. DT104]|nr:cobalt transporter ATP-binding subunit [Salmonella enterica subsp. enterica serovar Typhimurium str. DT104]
MGQKQLVNFASHFAEAKPIIILDEAFSNLDKKNLENLVSFLLDQQVTLLFILHNLDQELVAKFNFCLNFSENQIFLHPVTD